MNRPITSHLRLGAVGLACAALGAGASAIATAGAAAPTPTAPAAARRAPAARRLFRRTVHADLVVATKTGLVNLTIDRGTVKSISDSTLMLVEGNTKMANRIVQLTLPRSVRVRDNGHRASLTALQPGQRAIVIRRPKGTLVVAHTPRKH